MGNFHDFTNGLGLMVARAVWLLACAGLLVAVGFGMWRACS